jgi:hypothetical protein
MNPLTLYRHWNIEHHRAFELCGHCVVRGCKAKKRKAVRS